MNDLNHDCKIKSETITKRIFNKDGSELKSFVSTISYYGRSGFIIECIRLNKNGDIEKHSVHNEAELEKLYGLDCKRLDEEPDPFWFAVKRKENNDDKIYEYDENGRLSSAIKKDKKGQTRLEEYYYDNKGRRNLIKVIDPNGDERVIRQYYNDDTGQWDATSIEINGELERYTAKIPTENSNIDKNIELIYEEDKAIKIECISDKLNHTYERVEYENDILVKKNVYQHLSLYSLLDKISTYELIEGELRITQEEIHEYGFY